MLVRALVGFYYTMAHSLIRDHSLNHIYCIYYSSFTPRGQEVINLSIKSSQTIIQKISQPASYKVKFALIIQSSINNSFNQEYLLISYILITQSINRLITLEILQFYFFDKGIQNLSVQSKNRFHSYLLIMTVTIASQILTNAKVVSTIALKT